MLEKFLDACAADCHEYMEEMYRSVPLEKVRIPPTPKDKERWEKNATIAEIGVSRLSACVAMLRELMPTLGAAELDRMNAIASNEECERVGGQQYAN